MSTTPRTKPRASVRTGAPLSSSRRGGAPPQPISEENQPPEPEGRPPQKLDQQVNEMNESYARAR